MCLGCWEEEGRPVNDSPAIRELVGLLDVEVDEFGPLHILVSDWNVDDDDIRFCLHEATKKADARAADLAYRFLALSVPERCSVLALAEYPEAWQSRNEG